MAEQAWHASPGTSRSQTDLATATPSSDAGEIEEARAALLGDRYWVQISTPVYANGTSASKVARSTRPESSDDEVSQPPSFYVSSFMRN